MNRPLFVGNYLQITWWALDQWKGRKFAWNDTIVYPWSAWVLQDTPLEMLMCPKSNWHLEVLVFEESKKLEYLEKNLLKQEQKQTTNSTLMSSMPRLEPGHTLMGGNCAPLASWVPSLNINTLIPYTVHYHFFFNSCGTIFIIFTHSHELYVWSSKNNTRRNEMPTTFVTVHYTFSLTAWLRPTFWGYGHKWDSQVPCEVPYHPYPFL